MNTEYLFANIILLIELEDIFFLGHDCQIVNWIIRVLLEAALFSFESKGHNTSALIF